ncbi:hypothetical protein D9757_011009 [Collybiopsis confluens]|uniref:Uncharacterized protein n=1 Tax=Collybiopsis confluens TaxID=2823264 RepID=A0A8H5GD71_9AGAR|nr:hypothetical protein D9757_011009 [Collybiopsis confluens]
MLLGGYLLTREEACLFLDRDPDALDATVSTVALDMQGVLNRANLMLELVTWPDFIYSDDPKDTSYFPSTRAANLSYLQFSLLRKRYSRLPQFREREREQDVLKKLRELGLDMKEPKFVTVFKHDHPSPNFLPYPTGFRLLGPHPIFVKLLDRAMFR